MTDRQKFEAVKIQLVDDLNIDLVQRGTPEEHIDRILRVNPIPIIHSLPTDRII